jgi:hypothetical protein
MCGSEAPISLCVCLSSNFSLFSVYVSLEASISLKSSKYVFIFSSVFICSIVFVFV